MNVFWKKLNIDSKIYFSFESRVLVSEWRRVLSKVKSRGGDKNKASSKGSVKSKKKRVQECRNVSVTKNGRTSEESLTLKLKDFFAVV